MPIVHAFSRANRAATDASDLSGRNAIVFKAILDKYRILQIENSSFVAFIHTSSLPLCFCALASLVFDLITCHLHESHGQPSKVISLFYRYKYGYTSSLVLQLFHCSYLYSEK
jgi:hypothetical protein